MDLAHTHGLERRYDGPIPTAAPALAPVAATARAQLFDRLAGETRHATAHRRARLTHPAALADRRLWVLSHTLAAYRAHGVAWR